MKNPLNINAQEIKLFAARNAFAANDFDISATPLAIAANQEFNDGTQLQALTKREKFIVNDNVALCLKL